jgi:hypothetical protein
MTVNLTRIYTKLGDSGETHLGDMSRVPKTDPRIEAYGDVDELGAHIGVAITQPGMPERTIDWLKRIQNDLFDVGADLAVPEGDTKGAPARDALPGRMARNRMRRGQRDARTTALVPARRRQLPRRPRFMCAEPSAGEPSGGSWRSGMTRTRRCCGTSTA